jgi:hypothetical protein
MSKQLAISSALSVLLMAGFALFGAPATHSHGASNGKGLLEAAVPQLPAIKPAFLR